MGKLIVLLLFPVLCVAQRGNHLLIKWDSIGSKYHILRGPTDTVGIVSVTADGKVISWKMPWTNVIGKPSFFSGSYNDLTNKPTIPAARQDSTIYYNSSGRIHQRIKKWVGRVSVTNGSGQSIDISSAGFGTITSISVLAEKNATTAPNVSVKSYTTSAVVLNVKEENNAVVQILGINVLSGAPLIFATGTVWVWVTVEGY